MSMFSICMAFVVEGTLAENIAGLKEAESKFSAKAGVRFRRFFQCRVQLHAIWALTEWTAEKNHNDAAQSLMGLRRDDRIAACRLGPEPYFEIFCREDAALKVGEFSDSLGLVVVAHGLANERAGESLAKLREERFAEVGDRFSGCGSTTTYIMATSSSLSWGSPTRRCSTGCARSAISTWRSTC
ncbi:MAG: hypothetical protein V3S10_03285 [Dehalococcoidales bacterium]